MTCKPPVDGRISLLRSFYSRKDYEQPLVKIGCAAGVTTMASVGYCMAREMAHPNGLVGPFSAAAARSVRTVLIAALAGTAYGAGVYLASSFGHNEPQDHWANHVVGGSVAGAIWSTNHSVRSRRVIGFAVLSGAALGWVKHALQMPINWMGLQNDSSIKILGARLINSGAQSRVLVHDPFFKVDESPLLADLSVTDSRRNVHKVD